MTAIDRLLRRAGELNAASVKELNPAIEEIASVQASVADALEPVLEAMAGIAGAQPFRYGFVLPAEPPEFRPEQAESAPAPDKAEVNLGPINVYTIAGEIQKALDSTGRDSAGLRGTISPNVTKQPVQPASAPAVDRQSRLTARAQFSPDQDTPVAARAAGDKKPAGTARKIAPEEWVEESIKRSGVALKDLREVRKNMITSTITGQKIEELSADALSIGQAAAMGTAPPRLPEKPQKEEEPTKLSYPYMAPAVVKPRPPAENRPPAAPQREEPGKSDAAPTVEVREPALPGTVKAPAIRLRASPAIVPAQDADFNARSLSRARSMEAENSRPLPEGSPVRQEKMDRPVKVEWPVITASAADRPHITSVQPGEAPRQAWSGPAPASETRHTEASAPVTQVIRSFGTMGEALRAVSEIRNTANFTLPAAVIPPISEAGAPILNAMAGTAPVSRPESQEIGRLASTTNIGATAGSIQPAAQSRQAGDSSSPAVVFLPGAEAQSLRPAWGLAANISAAQASQRSGVATIQRLIREAPRVAGSIPLQAPVIYDSGRGVPFPGPVTPAAASGAENIVNIAVPPAAQSKVSETNTTTRVANFHNTFNITVNLQSAEEKDLKDLGKKIGQLLSEELKRYGGLS